MTTRLVVIGPGRLGREIIALAAQRDCEIVRVLGRDDAVTPHAFEGCDVAIDTSIAEVVPSHVEAALAARVPLVIGATGWRDREPELRAWVADAAGCVLAAPNFSVGVALFATLVADAARRLVPKYGFDAHLVETHHAAKRDAPSGTAIHLAAIATNARGAALPVTSVRTGHVPGTHALVFDAPFEQVTLVHEARDRRVFADGALLAARWLPGRIGWFTMEDVVRDVAGGHAS
jgi:4-hydroxy-tetrahydrodipicolinate reductase